MPECLYRASIGLKKNGFLPTCTRMFLSGKHAEMTDSRHPVNGSIIWIKMINLAEFDLTNNHGQSNLCDSFTR